MLGALIGGVASLFGAKSQSDAAKDAAKAQVEAAKIATEEQKRQFDAMMKRTEPQYQLGLSALGKQAFYAGVGAPTGFADKLSEIGAPQYPTIDPMTGKIKYSGTLGGNVNPPTSAIQNNQRQQGTWLNSPYKNPMGGVGPQSIDSSYSNQNWLEDFMKQQAIADYYGQGG